MCFESYSEYNDVKGDIFGDFFLWIIALYRGPILHNLFGGMDLPIIGRVWVKIQHNWGHDKQPYVNVTNNLSDVGGDGCLHSCSVITRLCSHHHISLLSESQLFALSYV